MCLKIRLTTFIVYFCYLSMNCDFIFIDTWIICYLLELLILCRQHKLAHLYVVCAYIWCLTKHFFARTDFPLPFSWYISLERNSWVLQLFVFLNSEILFMKWNHKRCVTVGATHHVTEPVSTNDVYYYT